MQIEGQTMSVEMAEKVISGIHRNFCPTKIALGYLGNTWMLDTGKK